MVIFSFFSLLFFLFLANKILKITREKPWARLTPRPTGRNLAALIGKLRNDADHGHLGYLHKLYIITKCDRSRDTAPARPAPAALLPPLTKADQLEAKPKQASLKPNKDVIYQSTG